MNVRAPPGGYFNINRRAKVTWKLKEENIQLNIKTEKSLRQACQRTTDSQNFRRLRGVAVPGSKDLASVDDTSSSRGVGWRLFVGPWCRLGKVGHSVGVCQSRCLQPDGDCWSLGICWRYFFNYPIRWDQSWRRSGIRGEGKKELTRGECLLMIFGPRLTSVGEVWSGPVLVYGIWSGSTSVEDVDAPT